MCREAARLLAVPARSLPLSPRLALDPLRARDECADETLRREVPLSAVCMREERGEAVGRARWPAAWGRKYNPHKCGVGALRAVPTS